MGEWPESFVSELGHAAGSCESGNDHSGSIECGKFLD